MPYMFKQTNSSQELVDYLNDIVLSMELTTPIRGLHGKTLVLGSSTVTFSDSSGNGLSAAQVVEQINAVVTGAASTRNYGHGYVPGPKTQIAIVKSGTVVQPSGTANSILGFSTSAAVTVGAKAVPQANIVAINNDALATKFTVIHV